MAARLYPRRTLDPTAAQLGIRSSRPWPVVLAAAMLVGAVSWCSSPVAATELPSLASAAIAQLPAIGFRSSNYPQRQHATINDYARLLSPEEQAQLSADLDRFRAATGIEIVVVTVPYYALYVTHDASFERFATNLFNTWGIGDARRNRGVLVLLSERDRKVRIELGRGYNHAYDQRMQLVVDEYMVPHFRGANYNEGLQRGIPALQAQLTKPIGPGEVVTTWPFWPLARMGGWLTAIAAAGVATHKASIYLKRPTCFSCQIKMEEVPEAETTRLLTTGQLAEREVNSVKHTFYKCPQCALHDVHNSILSSRFRKCPQCHYRTLQTLETTILEPATYKASGTARSKRQCCHCHHEDYQTIYLPRLEHGSGSSSYSGSSYDSGSSYGGGGGGSSDGGGASGSW